MKKKTAAWILCALLLICFVLMFIKSENDMMREDM